MSVSFSDLSFQALGDLRSWLEQNPPAIPIGNILGYQQFVASTQQAQIATQETTSSNTYTDLATVGPTITDLPPGKYLLFYMCQEAANEPTTIGGTTYRTLAYASIDYGAVGGAVDDDAVISSGVGPTAFQSVVGAKVVSLSANTNTVTMKYRIVNGPILSPAAYFQNRRLIALRYATL